MLMSVEPLVMGILNVTPDSFSDGGKFFDHDKAIARGLEMIEEGVDIVDIGGESSRPGATRVPEEEELRRVLPVVKELSSLVRVSIDTVKPAVARAAIDAGATVLNDISASLEGIAAANGVGWVAVHMQGEPASMQKDPHYEDVVEDVRTFLEARAEAGERAGVREIWIDPGIGFGKTVAHNLQLLAHLDVLVDTGLPVLVGTSRKSFLGAVLADPSGNAVPPSERFEGSLATAVWSIAAGAAMVRVHDVKATVQAAILYKSMVKTQV